MKYDVIQNADGDTTIVSTWVDNLNSAKSAFHNQCRNLYNDPETTKAVVGIFDEELNLVDDKKEYINKASKYYTIIFNSHGGSEVETQYVLPGEFVTRPDDPTRSGYLFLGWEIDGYAYGFNSPTFKDMILVAAWEKE